MFVNNAGMNPNEPYVIDYLKTRLRIHTNALTHLLSLWDRYKSSECRTKVLHTLLRYAADARAPALYEVTPLIEGAEISMKQGMLSAASGQSLMALGMSMHLDVPPPENFITEFRPSDPDGLSVKWALQLGGDPEWDIEFVIDFLCPLGTTLKRIAGGLLAPGEKASGQLRRLVRSFDSASKMNILHLFVSWGNHYDTNEILETFRMLRHVYGLSVLTPTQDERTVRAPAVESATTSSVHTREAVAMAVEEEILEQRRAAALPAARGLHRLPSSAIEMIGTLSGLPLQRAEGINERIDKARRSRRNLCTNKLRFVFLRMC